jgi:uncharacterized protein YdhG (YjbR/CyaY superfamily)
MALPTHEDYFAACSDAIRMRLEQIQQAVEGLIPGATRCVSYGMPAFRSPRTFFYFGAFKHHIGIYPPVAKDQGLIAETARFRGPRGNLSFPHDKPLPLELIGRVALALAEEYRVQT